MQRILIVRFGSIGNTLVSIPAVRAIKKQYPDSSITMIVSPGIDDLVNGIPWIDEVMVYDMYGAHRSLKGYVGFIRELRKRRFAVAILFKRFLRSELIGMLSGAKRRIGFQTEGRSRFLTDRVEYTEGENIVELTMKLVGPLGIFSNDLSLELGTDECTTYPIMSAVRGTGPGDDRRYAVIHPGGKTVGGQGMTSEGYASVIDRLAQVHHVRSVVIGDAAEAGTIQRILNTVGPGAASAAVGLPLRQVSCLIRRASLFIGNDSGPCHIADAVGTPGVIVYPPMRGLEEHIRKWKPAGDRYVAITAPRHCDVCPDYPCSDDARTACARAIDSDLVLRHAVQILNAPTEG